MDGLKHTLRSDSHCIFTGPLTRVSVVLCFVGLQKFRNLGHEGVVWVGIGEQRADRQENFRNGQGGRPLVLQDVEADASVRVDVTVINSGCERHLRWLEGVVGREMNVQEEDASGVRGVIGSHDGGLPGELILLVERPGRAVGGWVLAEVDEFLLDALESHIKFSD